MTTRDSHIGHTANTVCPIKSQLIHRDGAPALCRAAARKSAHPRGQRTASAATGIGTRAPKATSAVLCEPIDEARHPGLSGSPMMTRPHDRAKTMMDGGATPGKAVHFFGTFPKIGRSGPEILKPDRPRDIIVTRASLHSRSAQYRPQNYRDGRASPFSCPCSLRPIGNLAGTLPRARTRLDRASRSRTGGRADAGTTSCSPA